MTGPSTIMALPTAATIATTFAMPATSVGFCLIQSMIVWMTGRASRAKSTSIGINASPIELAASLMVLFSRPNCAAAPSIWIALAASVAPSMPLVNVLMKPPTSSEASAVTPRRASVVPTIAAMPSVVAADVPESAANAPRRPSCLIAASPLWKPSCDKPFIMASLGFISAVIIAPSCVVD